MRMDVDEISLIHLKEDEWIAQGYYYTKSFESITLNISAQGNFGAHHCPGIIDTT